jgi:hypothetical protein
MQIKAKYLNNAQSAQLHLTPQTKNIAAKAAVSQLTACVVGPPAMWRHSKVGLAAGLDLFLVV